MFNRVKQHLQRLLKMSEHNWQKPKGQPKASTGRDLGRQLDRLSKLAMLHAYEPQSKYVDATLQMQTREEAQLINNFYKSSSLEEAITPFKKMLDPSLRVDAGVFGRMVRYASERKHCILYQIQCLVIEVGIEADDGMQESLIDFYGSIGCLVPCHLLLQAKLGTSVSVWNKMITTHLDNDEIFGVHVIFRAMLMMEFPKPDEKVLANLMLSIPLYAPNTLLSAHAYIVKSRSLFPEVINTLLSSYCDFGYLENAVRMIEEYGEARSSAKFWNCAIDFYATHGLVYEAVKTFRAMVEAGWIPSKVTFVSLIDAFGHTGHINEALDIYQNMFRRHGVPKCREHFFALADAICRAGQFDKALVLISLVESKNREAFWRQVGVWGEIHGSFEAALLGFDNLSEWNAGDLKTLAHLYFKMGRFYESELFWEEYNKSGGEKHVGVSVPL